MQGAIEVATVATAGTTGVSVCLAVDSANKGDWEGAAYHSTNAVIGAVAAVDMVNNGNIMDYNSPKTPQIEPQEPALPKEAWKVDAPKQIEPGTQTLKNTHTKYNPETGEWEKSTVIYDQYGRQVDRLDDTHHGYPEDHSVPHGHRTVYNSRYPNGKSERYSQ